MNTQEPNRSWAGAIPIKQGLYDPEFEKDSCGVGFIVNVKGKASHSIILDSKSLLCNMTHRGAVGADQNDGDGAGIMSAIPHAFFERYLLSQNLSVPVEGTYAAGNLYFSPTDKVRKESQAIFTEIAHSIGLNVLCYRPIPRDNHMLGPRSRSKEPVMLQVFITMKENHDQWDPIVFERKLYFLRKTATHKISLNKWFYICSLSATSIVYKGQLSPGQVYDYFKDLSDPLFMSHFCIVHSRFSTNTFPSWDRAQPMRFVAHNGEINTLRGNKNWMRAREGVIKSDAFETIAPLFPIIENGGSDSSAFDNVLDLLVVNGAVSLPQAVLMMVPEAWEKQPTMDLKKRAFYEWSATLMEPWDGPALFTFSDGRYVGASLDRNGLRPCRFYITNQDTMICASEVGAVKVDQSTIISKGRLQPGKMLLVDTKEGRIIEDSELKMETCLKQPFGKWIDDNMIRIKDLRDFCVKNNYLKENLLDKFSIQNDQRMICFGFTLEQLTMIISPMVQDGKEALGSMGNDSALACLSKQPRPIYDYFRQLFAQVTNPPIDPIREEVIMSLGSYIGSQGNILEIKAEQCNLLHLPSPILSLEDLSSIRQIEKYKTGWKVAEINITYLRSEGIQGYIECIDRACEDVLEAIHHGNKIAVLSDRDVNEDRIPLSALVALGAVHHFLIRNKQRSKIALVVETAEAREVHHFCVLLGYGADAICPYLAFEAMLKLKREGLIKKNLNDEQIIHNFIKATNDGVKKVMSKMGISTLQSYKGAQIFEALGLGKAVIAKCFSGTASRINGPGFDILALDAFFFHEQAFPTRERVQISNIPEMGDYHWRDGGEAHINDPASIANLQDAVRRKNLTAYEAYSRQSYEAIKNCTLRGLLDFNYENCEAIPVEEVEPWTDIVKRFCTGAMSYGSISLEAHSTLAVALGGKSNTGEGGEDATRSNIMPNGESMRSAIKQVASGRFGVTSYYLSDADELQIKMAQGAKPGEGGELPAHKVTEGIAKTRKSTIGVGLISPPPHHDIYSIEDLKQLIYDLKCANPIARVSVKLVSEVGVGIVASGVAKARADHILISGHDGGTGASRWTGIKHAGLPWELGLAETHQTLVLNDLRGRIVLQTDGQIKTGRDVAVACLLGAEEWGFATAPLIALGCTMMRKCHLNTCPVGIATQDPELRKKFEGTSEDVINFFYYVAEECRTIMAKLGFRTINEMVGRTDFLKLHNHDRNVKTNTLDLSPILTPAFTLRPNAATHNVTKQDHMLHKRLDNLLIEQSLLALTEKKSVVINTEVVNTDRALCTTLSYEVTKRYGEAGLPVATIKINMSGSAGQSLGAFLASGISISLEGDANDYVGKGLSGGCIVVFPPKNSIFRPEQNIIVGNVCLYGATSGKAFFSGIAAERFAVRNSGALAVVEGCGDHGCEYMTGGRVIILGKTGRNFAAGMSGGIAYIFDPDCAFHPNCNMELIELERITEIDEMDFVRELINEHYVKTLSPLAQRVLSTWKTSVTKFVKVFPRDYKTALLKSKLIIQEDVSKIEKSQIGRVVLDIEDAAVDGERLKKNSENLDKIRGFMKYKRQGEHYRNIKKRAQDWDEINARMNPEELKVQAARCMDCGVPFCQSDSGCPISNVIPKWNDLIFKDQWQEALERLLMTNNFPEFTGRVCPAPCEGACVLGINELPVSIKSIECAIIDRGFEQGWMVPKPPQFRTGKTIAVIGSGPAGLAAADQLNKAGHTVTIYDRNDRFGGLLMYGIPNMKLDKSIVQRRIDLMAAEGIKFIPNADVGKSIDAKIIHSQSDAMIICTGASWPRDLQIPNRELNGIHFAMEFLQRNTKSLLDSRLEDHSYLSAKSKNVIVIGGGDTGNDCIGTSVRHGARSIINFELLPQPPATRAKDNPWPQYPRVMKIDYGHAEVGLIYGKDPREYCILSKEYVSDGHGNVKGINTVKVEWTKNEAGQWSMNEIKGSEQFYEADLVILAMGFVGPEKDILSQLSIKQDIRSNIETLRGKYSTNITGVFAAGDCRRGQSLIVWGINEGRQAAREVDIFLTGNTKLPITGGLQQRSFETGNRALAFGVV